MPMKRAPVFVIGICQGASSNNPADATTYYFSAFGSQSFATAYVNADYVIRRPCVLVAADIQLNNDVTPTNETWDMFIRKNDTTDTLIQNTGFSGAATSVQFSNLLLGVVFAPGDTFSIKIVTPTWATNPTGVRASGLLWFAESK
jgi:hypothetical protein